MTVDVQTKKVLRQRSSATPLPPYFNKGGDIVSEKDVLKWHIKGEHDIGFGDIMDNLNMSFGEINDKIIELLSKDDIPKSIEINLEIINSK